MTHPVLQRGHQNPHEWVLQAQQMLNKVRPVMDLDAPIAESGNFDEATEHEVIAFQTREGLQKIDGIVGPETWGALWSALTERQQQDQAQATVDEGLAPAPGAHEQPADPPPSLADIDTGRDTLTYYVDDIVAKAQEFAARVSGLGEPAEVLPKLLDAADNTGMIIEIFGIEPLAESAIFVGGATALSILAPLAMWYEAIQANNAGELHGYRWAVYNAFMAGFWPGLYDQGAQSTDQLLVPVRDQAHSHASGLAANVKKGIRGLLLAMSGAMDYIPDASNPTISPEHWALAGPNYGWTWQGLETFISHHDA